MGSRVRDEPVESLAGDEQVLGEIRECRARRELASDFGQRLECVGARLRKDERCLARDDDALVAARIECDVREDGAHRREHRSKLAPLHVVELHPLLQNAARREPVPHDLVELPRVEVGRAREPDARDLDADKIEALGRHEEGIATILRQQSNARVGKHATVDAHVELPSGFGDRG